jgi:hypothetical protein
LLSFWWQLYGTNQNIMQKLLLILLICGNRVAMAQVSISATASTPNASAMLDVQSTTKGFLLPRMTAVQRNAIASPANGLAVYDTDSAAVFIRQASQWIKQQNTSDVVWRKNGNNIFNANSNNVGIGTNDPDVNAKLHIVLPNSTNIPNVQIQSLQTNNAFGLVFKNPNGLWSIGQNLGNFNDNRFVAGFTQIVNGVSTLQPQSVFSIFTNGNVGIGNFYTGVGNQALQKLEVSGAIKMSDTASGTAAVNGTLRYGMQGLQVKHNNLWQSLGGGSVGQWTTNGNNISNSNTGNIGIGTNTPYSPITFNNNFGNKISLWGDAANQIGFGVQGSAFQLYSDAAVTDIRFGHGNSSNFTERMRIDGNGRVGIGNVVPYAPLTFPSTTGGKISFSGDANRQIGIGAAGSGLQLYARDEFQNIFFGYGNSTNFFENMRLDGFGNLGLRNSAPFVPLSFENTNGRKIAFNGDFSAHVGMGVFANTFEIYTDATNRHISFGTLGGGNFSENIRFTGDGKVGIGTTLPIAPLSFEDNFGEKISLYGTTANNIGMGVQGGTFQIHSDAAATDIAFGYGSSSSFTERMRIKGNGNVGIGNNQPFAPLSFNNNFGQKLSLYGTASSNIGLGVQGGTFQIHSDAAGTDIAFGYGSSSSFTERMRIKGNGNVGIGTNNPEASLMVQTSNNPQLYVRNPIVSDFARIVMQTGNNASRLWTVAAFNNADAGVNDFLGFYFPSLSQPVLKMIGFGDVTVAGLLFQNSDVQLKKNIKPLSNSLQQLQQLNGYTYQWKDDNRSKKEQIGLLAQEIQQVFPQLVASDDKGELSVNYTGLIPVLLEAVKAQQKQIDTQQKQIDELKKIVLKNNQ